jgi:hypothetical protein
MEPRRLALSLVRAAWFPALVFGVHCVLSLGFNAYDKLEWLDVLMHFLGGAAIAHFFDGCVGLGQEAGFVSPGDRAARLLIVFGLVAFATVAWEWAEFVADTFFQAGAQRSIANTMKDQFLGVLGGVVYVASRANR